MIRAIDLFAGAGGSTTGAVQAGAHVIWAADHWRTAVDIHTLNHPDTHHECQDLTRFPACDIPDHDLLLASPSCKGFSPARGRDQAHHDTHRSTPFVVLGVLEEKRPAFAVVENVKEMRDWELYGVWKAGLHALGYSVREYILNAEDFSVPQSRPRLFVVASLSKHPVDLAFEKKPRVPVQSVLDWEAGSWSEIDNGRRSSNTLARIAQAIQDGLGPRFLIPYYSSGSGKTGRCVNRPIGTLTTRDRYALVDTDTGKMRMLSVEEARACMGFPASYLLPEKRQDAITVLGNAVCPPVMREIVRTIQMQG